MTNSNSGISSKEEAQRNPDQKPSTLQGIQHIPDNITISLGKTSNSTYLSRIEHRMDHQFPNSVEET
jgi:hypothetical protein